ncbi:MAG: phage portal protein [Sphingomonadaceae bacterium]
MALRPLPNPASAPATRAAVLAAADKARLRRYAEYLEFYDGKQWAKPRHGRSNLVLNYARAIVDKGVSYLLGRGINFAVPPAGPSSEEQARASAAEELLYRVYEGNDLEAVDIQGALNGAILGDTVFKVFWGQRSGGWSQGTEGIRVVNIDPFTFFPRWASDDPSTLLSVSLVYRLSAEEAERRWADAEPRGHGGTERGAFPRASASPCRHVGEEVEVVEEWTPSQFVLAVGDREVLRAPNPYGFIPFVHIPNVRPANEFWGTSDLKDLMPLNRELNERMSDVADVIRFHCDPPVIFKGVTEHSNLAVGPGTVWDVPEGAEVELLEWRGQAPAVHEHIERVMRAIHDVTETPKTAFGDSGRLLSGVALETELQPLIQKTLRKRTWWNAGLRQRNRQILRIAELKGLGSFAPYRSRVIWPPLLPADDEVEVRNNVALVAAGLRSRRTAMDRLGEENPEEELRRIGEEAGSTDGGTRGR